ncbi:MAG: helix-turn-helix domain-containing protein [Bdellovibrionales bacterium]|nr:helix-turn-helix domain-containing protein [Bdellovibrionales bacterium]
MSKKIQTQRKSLRLSQEELAKQVDLSPLTIQFIEQGRRYPSLPILIYICKAMGINLKLD